MCRLALMNYQGALYVEARYGLARYFEYLEDSNGGMGNGVAILRNGRFSIRKGLLLTAEECTEMILKKKFEWALFHTRIPSAGKVSDRNCHPFRRGNIILAMNGTESGFKTLASALGDITDTEAVLITMRRLGLPVEFLADLSSVFMGFEGHTPFVACGATYRDLALVFDPDTGAIIFASEFPEVFKKVYELPTPFFWRFAGKLEVPGGAKLVDNKSRTSRIYSYYYRGGWWWNEDDRDLPVVVKKDDTSTALDEEYYPPYHLNGREYRYDRKLKRYTPVFGD